MAVNLVDPAAAPVVIEKAKEEEIPVVFYNKEPSKEALASYDKAYYVGTDSKESGIIQGRITSYNVCYTKLLRTQVGFPQAPASAGNGGFARGLARRPSSELINAVSSPQI